jgi:hypothetical protein
MCIRPKGLVTREAFLVLYFRVLFASMQTWHILRVWSVNRIPLSGRFANESKSV